MSSFDYNIGGYLGGEGYSIKCRCCTLVGSDVLCCYNMRRIKMNRDDIQTNKIVFNSEEVAMDDSCGTV